MLITIPRHARAACVAIAFASLSLMMGCGGSPTDTVVPPPPPAPPPPPPAGTTITAAGGTVSSTDGHATLTFPAGAVSGSLSVTATPSTDAPLVPQLVPGTAYDFGPSGSQFTAPVTIKLSYLPSQLPQGVSPLFLALYTRSGSTWQEMPGSVVDTNAHTVTGTTMHFSGFTSCSYPCAFSPAVTATFERDSFIVISPGGSVSWPGAVEQANYVGNTTVTLPDLPPGLTGYVSFTGVVVGNCQVVCFKIATLNLTAAPSLAPGGFSISTHAVGDATTFTHEEHSNVHIVATPGFTVSSGLPNVSVAQGGSVNSTITVNRTSFTGTVTLSARGLPGGVSASFNPATVIDPATSSIMTLTASASAVAGSYPITIAGNAPGSAEHTAVVTLTVSNFTIAGTPPTVTVAPGATASTGIKATRGGGSVGAITYTVAGVPGVSGVVTPTGVTDSSSLSVTVAANVSPGTYQLTLTGTNGGQSQQTSITVVVASASSNRIDFTGCGSTPIWVGYQDGNGAWTRLTGNSNVYIVPTLAAGVGGFAYVSQNGAHFGTSVTYAAQSEFATTILCPPAPSGITVTGSTANFAVGHAYVAMGGTFDEVGPASSFHLTNVASGAQDLIAYLQSDLNVVTPAVDRFLIKRDLAISGGGSAGTVDFTGNGSFAPATATITVAGTDGPLLQDMTYSTSGCTSGGVVNGQNGLASTFTTTGVPAAQQRAADLHTLNVTDAAGSSSRFVSASFHTFTDMTLALGAPLAPVVTTLSGSYLRLQMVVATTDYPYLTLEYLAGNSDVRIVQTAAYRGGGSGTVAMPELAGVSGFLTAWQAPSGTAANYMISGDPTALFAPRCGVGTLKSASVFGSH